MNDSFQFEKLSNYLRQTIYSQEQLISEEEVEETPTNFTEVFSWGSDRFGQLGLGDQNKKVNHCLPRLCSYSIPISQVACGQKHTVILTTNHLCYSMGANDKQQLGQIDSFVEKKTSPGLVDSLLGLKAVQVACGSNHTLVVTARGDCLAWGDNSNGQCGTTAINGLKVPQIQQPTSVNMDIYYKSKVLKVSAGGNHSAFVDDCGRLFTCGQNSQGQLGIANYEQQNTPIFVERVPDRVFDVACGFEHTLVLSQKGDIYAMGANNQGQLGTGQLSNKGVCLPCFLDDLAFTKMLKIRAGTFSAALSAEGSIYVWGEGSFGSFHTPHRIKSTKKMEVKDIQISNTGQALLLSESGQVYSWGPNEIGQLGHGDREDRSAPQRIKSLSEKSVTQIGVGDGFAFALGQTLPQEQIKKIILENKMKKDEQEMREQLKRQNRRNKSMSRKSGSAAATTTVQDENKPPSIQVERNCPTPFDVEPLKVSYKQRSVLSESSGAKAVLLSTSGPNNQKIAFMRKRTRSVSNESKQVAPQHSRISILSAEVGELRLANKVLSERASNAKSLEKTCEELFSEVKQLEFHTKVQGQKLEEVEKVKTQIQEDYQITLQRVSELTNEVDTLQSKLTQLTKCNEELQSQILGQAQVQKEKEEEQRNIVEEIRKENQQLAEELEEKSNQLQDSIHSSNLSDLAFAQLEVKLREKQDENDLLRQKIQQLCTKINTGIYEQATIYRETTLNKMRSSLEQSDFILHESQLNDSKQNQQKNTTSFSLNCDKFDIPAEPNKSTLGNRSSSPLFKTNLKQLDGQRCISPQNDLHLERIRQQAERISSILQVPSSSIQEYKRESFSKTLDLSKPKSFAPIQSQKDHFGQSQCGSIVQQSMQSLNERIQQVRKQKQQFNEKLHLLYPETK